MQNGTVISYNEIIGEGFILPDDGKGKIRVSHRDVKTDGYRLLYEGERVEFDAVMTPRGRVARHAAVLPTTQR